MHIYLKYKIFSLIIFLCVLMRSKISYKTIEFDWCYVFSPGRNLSSEKPIKALYTSFCLTISAGLKRDQPIWEKTKWTKDKNIHNGLSTKLKQKYLNSVRGCFVKKNTTEKLHKHLDIIR